jgi:hypothetical protein
MHDAKRSLTYWISTSLISLTWGVGAIGTLIGSESSMEEQ